LVPIRFAGDMAAPFTFADANARYQEFLQRGKSPIKGLIESVILYPHVVVPTDDYMPLAVLVGVLGERAVLDMLDAGKLRFARLHRSLAYVGNGGGLLPYQIGTGNDTTPPAASADKAIAWALGGLNEKVKDPKLSELAAKATSEVDANQLCEVVRHETYTDILKSPSLRAEFAIRSTEMSHLAGIGANQVRIYGGPGTPVKDEIDKVLMLAAANVEMRLADLTDADDISTINPALSLLNAKVERTYGTDASKAFIELKEIANISDIGEVVLQKSATISDLIKLSLSTDGIQFQQWFHDNCRKDTLTTAKEYANLLKQIPAAERGRGKTLRFAVTSAIGAIPVIGAIAGPAVTAIDSFVLDRFLKGHSPKYFIEKLEKLTSK
jgi:hypothetical protein